MMIIQRKIQKHQNHFEWDECLSHCCGGSSSLVRFLFISFTLISIFLLLSFTGYQKDNNTFEKSTKQTLTLPPWRNGYLDIHHIHAGVNVATFIIFPDGTTMLIDCGDIDIAKFQQKYGTPTALYPKLDVVSPYPNDSKTTGQWVIDYIHHFWPHPDHGSVRNRKVIDLMMITHFHQDHIGSIYTSSQQQKNGTRGEYIRTGIVEVGDEIDFHTIIDRGYPNYDFPFDLEKEWESAPFLNYLKYLRSAVARGTTVAEKFQVGSYTQIGLRKASNHTSYGHFAVRNIKANLEYSYAMPHNQNVKTIDGQLLYPAPDRKSGYVYDENKVSTAIVVEYGKFRYYEGGDQEYHNYGYPHELKDGTIYDLDTVTPTAEVAGRVHVATLNHHGHGVLDVFCRLINPKVLVLQGWCTDQPPNHSMETIQQSFGKATRDVFATWISDERMEDLGDSLRNMFKSTTGHVVVRVEPPSSMIALGDENNGGQSYHVYVLDGDRRIDKYFGPYEAD
jgi:hypothetical protein